MDNTSDNTPSDNKSNRLINLEKRIDRIEEYLNLTSINEDISETITSEENKLSEIKESLEFRIGEFWLVRVGIIALALGIIFLLTFPYQNLPPILPSLFGYVLVAGIFWLSYYWRESFSYISRYLVGGGLLLLYFSTMRLHFFSTDPVITNLNPELGLLFLIVLINIYISIRRKSAYLTGMSLALGYITAILSDQAYSIFIFVTILSLSSVYIKLKYQWYNFITLSILLTYFTHFTWFTNNPFLGNELQIVSSPEINVIFLVVYAIIFALGNLFREKDLPEDDMLIVNTLLNCLSFFVLFLIITLTTFKTNLPVYYIFASAMFLSLSILFWLKEKSKYSTFAYCIIGFMSLSVAIIAGFDKPDYFIWLCWQSLLVAMVALWFRSKIIIIANFIIYVSIFLSYLFSVDQVSVVSVSFGLVALLSARIMNWQKHRLEIKTEMMRNTYLTSAFIVFPYALFYWVPDYYVSLSWIAVAILYYILSLILKNIKYRWMALLTLLLSVLYVFIIDITKLEPVYRIISFMVLGVVLLIISLVYTRIRAKRGSSEINQTKI
jgi:uncharacterized membrane protein